VKANRKEIEDFLEEKKKVKRKANNIDSSVLCDDKDSLKRQSEIGKKSVNNGQSEIKCETHRMVLDVRVIVETSRSRFMS
jgi:hypothetical protein